MRRGRGRRLGYRERMLEYTPIRAGRVAIALMATPLISGCGDACDEEAECQQAPYHHCRYDGCGQMTCLADFETGHVICNEDGTQGCSAWPQQIATGCETIGTLEEQAACTELVGAAVHPETPPENVDACANAMLEIVPCILDGNDSCPSEALDALCFELPFECE